MPDTIRVVDYFYLMVPDKPGEVRESSMFCGTLA